MAMLVNGFGAICTGGTVLVVVTTKFIEGAWITVLMIPCIIALMYAIRRHYEGVAEAIANPAPLVFRNVRAPIIVMPMITWNKIVRQGLQFALNLSSEIHVLHVDCGNDQEKDVRKGWSDDVETPMKNAGLPAPKLTILKSPYRFVINPIVDYVLSIECKEPERQIAVIIPELVQKRWYQYFLHNQRAEWLKAALLLKGNEKIVIINVPWYLKS